MGKKNRGNGEGTIFKRERNGKILWVAEYTNEFQDPITGKRKIVTFYGEKREEVSAKLDKHKASILAGTYVEKNKIVLKDVAKQYIEDLYKLNKIADSAYVRKINTYNQICRHYIADMELQKITKEDVKDFLIYIAQYSNSVIGKAYGLMNNVFKIAVRKNIIKNNFLDDKLLFCKPKSKKQTKKVCAFTVEEQQEFITAILHDNHFKHHYQMLLELYTGMRMGEINALDYKDINFVNKSICIRRTITKDKQDRAILGETAKTQQGIRVIYMNSQAEYVLREYIKNEYKPNKENLLFYDHHKNTYISTNQINMSFKRFCEHYNIAQGYNVNQHMLRHTFATRCIESGMPANVLSKILGHKDITTTLNVYCDVFALYEQSHVTQTNEYLMSNNLLLVANTV